MSMVMGFVGGLEGGSEVREAIRLIKFRSVQARDYRRLSHNLSLALILCSLLPDFCSNKVFRFWKGPYVHYSIVTRVMNSP